ALLDPKAAAAGWLVGLAFWAQLLVGALTLIMIHRLTGGRWGEVAAPVIEPAAAAVPLLVVLAIPLFMSIPTLYPWPHQPAAIKTDVLSYYLNIPSFIVRALLALIGWSALALFLPRVNGRSGRFLAAHGLVFHALIISFVSIDWYLSLEAPFTSSSFGASVAVTSLVSALAFTALLAPIPEDDAAIGDIGGLLLATVLGITYIDFMAVLVIWYGDLPREEIWFVERDRWPWDAVAAAAFLLASVVPVLALLLAKVRNARRPLRAVGACVLIGVACYHAYLIAPLAGWRALVAALVAVSGIGLALLGLFMSGVTTLFPFREPADVR
ncbi:MAG: hypothetical protein WBG15_16710, partial [Xanthobacteraceae bacterium]